jgi:site-specific DNA recombinase
VSAPALVKDPDAFSYVRISKARGDPNDPETSRGVVRQDEENRAMAAQLGWLIVRTFTDNDVTASGKTRRPEWEALLAALEAGVVRRLIVWHLDRLLRIRGDLDLLIDVITRRKVEIVTVKSGEVRLDTATGRLTHGMLTLVSTYELEHLVERVKAMHDQLARDGRANGGVRSFGYEPGRMEIREWEADLVKHAAEQVLDGASINSITSAWKEAGVPTVSRAPRLKSHQPGDLDRPSRWSARNIWNMLTSARISGRRETFPLDEHGRKPVLGTIVSDAVWPGIITPEQSDRLREMLTDPRRRTNRGSSIRPLAGLVWCGLCGDRVNSKKVGVLRCSDDTGCGRLTIRAKYIEETVQEAVLQFADGGGLARLLAQTDTTGAQADLAALDAQDRELAARWGAGLITAPAWDAAREQLQARRAPLVAQIDRQRRSAGLADIPLPLRAHWSAMEGRHQRRIYQALIRKIVIQPATRRGRVFDPERVQVTYAA